VPTVNRFGICTALPAGVRYGNPKALVRKLRQWYVKKTSIFLLAVCPPKFDEREIHSDAIILNLPAWYDITALEPRHALRGKEIKMLTIDDLKNVRRMRLRVISLQERIERLRAWAEYPQRQFSGNAAKDTTRDRLAEYMADLDELERQLTRDMVTLERAVMAVDTALTILPANQEIILRLRYCEGLPWQLVAKSANYSVSHCRRIEARFRKGERQ